MTSIPTSRDALPGLLHAVKTTLELGPGDSIRIAGAASYPIAAAPIPLSSPYRGEAAVCVPLAWSPLALVAAPTARWDALSVDPPIWQHRSCPACGGSGRCPDPWNWRHPR